MTRLSGTREKQEDTHARKNADGRHVHLVTMKPMWVHNAQPSTTAIVFDAWGVGDSGAAGGTPLNPLGYDPSWQWHGLRINVEGAYAAGPNIAVTNLQTFLLINGVPTVPSSPLTGPTATQLTLAPITGVQMQADRLRLQEMLSSPVLQARLTERAARIYDSMKPLTKGRMP